MGQSSTIMQIVTPIGARYLSPGKKYIFFLIGDSPGANIPCYTFWKALVEPMLLPGHLTCNAVTYCFYIRGQNLGIWGPLGLSPPKRET